MTWRQNVKNGRIVEANDAAKVCTVAPQKSPTDAWKFAKAISALPDLIATCESVLEAMEGPVEMFSKSGAIALLRGVLDLTKKGR